MPKFRFSANATASVPTSYNSLVTSSASASASSSVSLEDAQQVANSLALNIATQNATHDAHIINQAVGIVDNQFVQPLQKFQKSLTSTSNLRIDQVIASLDAFKKAVYNVNYLTNLVNIYSQEIINAGQYASVLKPIVEKEFLDDIPYFNLFSLPNNLDSKMYLVWKQNYSLITNQNVVELAKKLNIDPNIFTSKSKFNLDIVNNLISKYPNQEIYNYMFVSPWTNSSGLNWKMYRKDLLNLNQYICIDSSVDLNIYFPGQSSNYNQDPTVTFFSPEYIKFVNDLANEIAILNGEDWQVDAIWPYANPSNFANLKCVSSTQYPEWTGKLISQCFIPGSDIDVPSTIYGIMVDLYYNYPNLVPGQIALVTYALGNHHYVGLLKIDTYNGQLCFKQKSIQIEPYFTSALNITNDIIINGSLNVKTYDGQDIIKTDNITKTTAFHTKIGVNQEISKVKGLIDVDNLSANVVINMMNEFVNPLLYSYEVTMDIKETINYGDTNLTIPESYQDNVFVFKTPIVNAIQPTDINILYVPNTISIAKEPFTNDTFTRIQTIVNELNKMQPEFDLNSDTQAYTFSFVELINDTNYSYLSSLRGVIKINPNDENQREIFFIGSSLDVTEYTINVNYKPYMISLVDKFSSCCRLLNYSNLICLDPAVQANLLKGQSISGSTDTSSPFFSDRINNSPYFRERFGGKDLYVYAFEYLTNQQLTSANTNTYLLSELFPYFNNNQSNTLYKPDTDNSTFLNHIIMLSQFNNLYGENKQDSSFFVKYDWIKGNKIAAVNLINIQGTLYLIGTGVNLSDVLDETVIAKGDNKITGNLAILDDTTNVPVFNVDREKKQTSSIYHTGIGTTNPQTMLDVNDCGIANIINVVNGLASQYNLINYNLQGLIATLNAGSNVDSFIENHFIDPSTGVELEQDINDYVYAIKIPENLSVLDTKFVYHWLYQNWNGNSLQELLQRDINSQQALNFAKIKFTNLYNNNNFFNLCNLIDIFSWVAGIKVCLRRNLIINNNNYVVGMGINLQNYLTYESNDNIQQFFQCLLSYSYQLQDLIIRYTNIPSSDILNQQKASDVRYQYSQKFPIQNLFQYTIDLTNIDNITISNLDYDTLVTSNTQKYSNITDVNLTTKLLFLFTNLKKQYTSINENDYGIVAFEDKYNDFVSLFWCSNVTGNVITLISLELRISSIVIPSLNLKGDMKINGDTYFTNSSNPNNTNTYAFIDTTHNFFGVNTLETVSNYANTYVTTTNGSFAKNNVYIKSETYPNTIIERTAENSDPSDNNYFRFKNFSTLSARRNSDLYTFNELYTNSQKYTTTNSPGLINCYGTNTNKYHYGPDMTYEIKDKTGVVKEIGNTHIVIDELENNNDGSVTLRGGFGVSMVDPLPNGSSQEREILYVDNNSQLHVNSIMLGGKLLSVDENGNLLFDGKKVTLN